MSQKESYDIVDIAESMQRMMVEEAYESGLEVNDIIAFKSEQNTEQSTWMRIIIYCYLDNHIQILGHHYKNMWHYVAIDRYKQMKIISEWDMIEFNNSVYECTHAGFNTNLKTVIKQAYNMVHVKNDE